MPGTPNSSTRRTRIPRGIVGSNASRFSSWSKSGSNRIASGTPTSSGLTNHNATISAAQISTTPAITLIGISHQSDHIGLILGQWQWVGEGRTPSLTAVLVHGRLDLSSPP
ncbi:MAG: hypothetical protein QOF88_4647, partial [Mycobacterium sp.]|nr:hypothetical protein [Mycobacterium sp.]